MKMTPIKTAILGGLFAATAADAINVDANFNGLWYRTDVQTRTGWALDYVKVGPERGLLNLTGYVYDTAGQPTWVSAQSFVNAGDSSVDFALKTVEHIGSTLNSSGTVSVLDFADLTMTFDSCTKISATIDNISTDLIDNTDLSFELTPFDGQGLNARDADVCPYQVEFTSCPSFSTPAQQPRTCIIQGTLTGNKTLTNNTNWVLNGPVFVGEDGGTTANLTIEPGTRVLGVSGNDFMAVQRGSKIFAEGTPTAPIVFTGPYNASSPEAGSGNWGGLIISGKAPLNICDDSVPFGQCEAVGEGGSGLYGGDDPYDSSGVIKYVRIQFGGFRINDEDELNGLSVQGAGSGTVLDYIQIHANEDDGIEFYGGTANAKHLVMTDIKDDSLDWTHGWQGNLQYVLVKQNPNASSVKERGIEADNFENNNEATPRSQPMIANATFIGGPSEDKTTTGMVLRRGTGANFTNVIVTGFEECIDLDSVATFDAAGTPENLTGTLTMENMVISCDLNFKEEAEDTFTVQSFFEAQPGNRVIDPALNGIYPTTDTPTGMAIDAEKWGPFFDKVNYIGAFKDQSTAWTSGWTEFLD